MTVSPPLGPTPLVGLIKPNKERRMKLRAGVVGLGKQALEGHISGLKGSDCAELVAVCDDNTELVREHQYRLTQV